MTLDELAVLRELARWGRNHGAAYGGLSPKLVLGDGKVVMWLRPHGQATCMKVGVTPDYGKVQSVWHKVESITQALDLLVALGYLPARFSTAYRAGWEAATTWHGVSDSDTAPSIAFAKMFHDPDNISFPAWESSW